MIKKPITIQLSDGLEARPIALLVQEASQYSSTIHIEVDNKKVNAKSIMGMMTLGFNKGEQIKICAEGNDEDNAVKKMEQFLSGQQ